MEALAGQTGGKFYWITLTMYDGDIVMLLTGHSTLIESLAKFMMPFTKFRYSLESQLCLLHLNCIHINNACIELCISVASPHFFSSFIFFVHIALIAISVAAPRC